MTKRTSRKFNKGKRYGKSSSMGLNGGSSGMSTGIVENNVPLFPIRTRRMLRYNADAQMTATSGVMQTRVYTANGLYDPDITGTGHQPMGFDTMMQYYEHYHAYYSVIKVVYTSTSSSPFRIGIRLDADASPLSDFQTAIENGRMVWDTCAGSGFNAAFCKKLTMSCNVVRSQGLTMTNYLADEGLRGSVAANPTEQTYFHVCIWDPFGITCNANVTVTIEYHAIFTEPKPLIQSMKRVEQKVERKTPPSTAISSTTPVALVAAGSSNTADVRDDEVSLLGERLQILSVCTCGAPL